MSYLVYSLAWRLIRLLPEAIAYRLGDSLAAYALRRGGRRVLRLEANLRVVRPSLNESEMSALLHEAMRSNLRYWIDTFRFPSWSEKRIRESVEVVNREVFDEAMAAGNGLVVALPHAGNWDHAGAFFCAEGHPLVTVAEHLKPERLFRKFLAYRQAMGMEVLDLDGRVMKTLEERLRSGRLLALVSDRDLSVSAIEVRFFGKRAKFPAGPARLARECNAPLITAYISYNPNGIRVEFSDPIPTNGRTIEAIVQEIATNFESGISRYPQDWHMLQRVFLEEDRA